ncbi:hypothetical protein [Tardiphaga sp. 839_C3_N1_4]|uniref:hypothetical protein n=1 Tax=Tardiphaga sp. 839_C3_N1_4 TaxID=3240761 RepID=UPI003F248950
MTTRFRTMSSRNYQCADDPYKRHAHDEIDIMSAGRTSISCPLEGHRYHVRWKDNVFDEVHAPYNAKHLQLDFTACIVVIGILEHTAA